MAQAGTLLVGIGLGAAFNFVLHRRKQEPIPSKKLTIVDSASEFSDLSSAWKKASERQDDSKAEVIEEATTSLPEEEQPLQPGDPDWGLHEPVDAVDPRDAATGDKWIPRNPALIRLTGRHPFNCEPPPTMLMEKGPITPVSLHYVRNHGKVPELDWKCHTVTIKGLVDHPMTLSMDDLVNKFEAHTIPVTLVCAGNRRKEQNMVKRTKGFNWGPAATGTTYWTGVRLCDVLRHCGAHRPSQGAHYVCFNSIKGELPQGTDGSYGTSLAWHYAMDPANDVMLCYKQNGRLLTPDHGYPVRMLIPGFIGGRMVKWLSEIKVWSEESDNFYHFKDNRVLPPNVDHEKAETEGWWYKPEYIINELNINSVITSPAYDEKISVSDTPMYDVKGYAYAGAGKKVIRVEISLDSGDTWRLTEITRPFAPTEYGKHWCWVLWKLAVPTLELVRAGEVRVRAVDETNNLQPERLTWNVMGMMNNPAYRVKLNPDESGASIALTAEHPVKAGPDAGGWMEREAVKVEEEAAAAEAPKAQVDESSLKEFSMAEVAKHDSHESAWFVHDGMVFDATPFMKEHPGGADSILLVAGQDATDEFNAIHSARAKGMLPGYLIGKLSASAGDEEEAIAEDANPSDSLLALNPRKKIAFPLIEKKSLSHNTRLLRFGLPSKEHRTGLPVGQHMFFYAKVDGELVMRAYTPTSSDEERGYFDLVIKVYFSNAHPSFPLGGKMTQYLESMRVGDTIDVKGPLGHFVYEGRGHFRHHGHPGLARELSMIAGGTGITPMWQVIQAVLRDPLDETRIKLLFANQTEEDILLGPELEEFAKDSRVSVHFMLSRPSPAWTGTKGRVNESLIRKHLFPASDETLCLLCGPQGMIDQACMPNLKAVGYTDETIVIF